MRRIARWLGYGLGSIVILALIAVGGLWLVSAYNLSRSPTPQPEVLPVLTAAEVRQGPRLLRVLGCAECHGPGLRGRLFFEEPNVAKMWAPNLTLIAAQASDEQLAQAIRQGIGHDGRSLWIMPSGLYSRLGSKEVAALVSAIRAQPRGGASQPRMQVGPIGRLGIALGKLKSSPATIAEFSNREPFYAGKPYERGRQLARKICADCHAPDLTGGQPGFDKPPPDLQIAASYDSGAFKRLIRTGRPPDGRDLGLMRTMAEQGMYALHDDEITAMHDYLRARAERMGR